MACTTASSGCCRRCSTRRTRTETRPWTCARPPTSWVSCAPPPATVTRRGRMSTKARTCWRTCSGPWAMPRTGRSTWTRSSALPAMRIRRSPSWSRSCSPRPTRIWTEACTGSRRRDSWRCWTPTFRKPLLMTPPRQTRIPLAPWRARHLCSGPWIETPMATLTWKSSWRRPRRRASRTRTCSGWLCSNSPSQTWTRTAAWMRRRGRSSWSC
mmetsp:Transcript_11582/g.33384  ORF Transcript_11582/g.33384 Transcript_11582/m.33384 type:complete len:212 (+) Transcript_11582:209-844(+)